MIRIQGKDGRVRSVGGGDPKLKVALPPVASQPLEVKREKAAVAMASVSTKMSTKPEDMSTAPKKGEPGYWAWRKRMQRKAQGTPLAQG